MKPDQQTTPAKQPSALSPSDIVIPVTTQQQSAEAAACCTPTTMASCCSPAAKSTCCGTDGAQCGCK